MMLPSKFTARLARAWAVPRRRRPWIAVAGLACVLAASAGCTARAQAQATGAVTPRPHCDAGHRGRVLSAALLLRLSRAQVASELKAGGLKVETRYGIRAYRVIYCTVSPSRQPVIASGLLVLPQGTRDALSLVSYDHSTVAKKEDRKS